MTDHAIVMRAGEAVERGSIARAPRLAPAPLHGGLRRERARDGGRLRGRHRPGAGGMSAILGAGRRELRLSREPRRPARGGGRLAGHHAGPEPGPRGRVRLRQDDPAAAPAGPGCGPRAGRVLFDGVPLDLGDRSQVRAFRRSVQTVFQDPYSSLDPRQRVGRIVGEPVRSLRIANGRAGRRDGRGGARVGRAVCRRPRPTTRTSSPAASASASPSRGPS